MSDPYSDRLLVPGLKRAIEIVSRYSDSNYLLGKLREVLKSAEDAGHFYRVNADKDEAQVQ